MPAAVNTSAVDADYLAFSDQAKTVNSLFDEATSDYEAAVKAIEKSNASREAAINGSADLETKTVKLRDDADALAKQEGSLPPAIPVPEVFQATAPIAARARRK